MKKVKKEHFYWLDAVRFLAAFMVLLSHTRNNFFPAYGDLPSEHQNIISMAFIFFCRMGHEAVIIFFVLSGFLVGGRGFERIKENSMNVGSYGIDRFARITPPLLAAILFYYITSLVIPGTPFSWVTAIGNLFSLQGICCPYLVNPFWSLSYEVWFYILLGFLAMLLTKQSEYVRIAGFIMFAASASVFVLGLNYHYLFVWILGALAYIVRPKTRNKWVLILSFCGFFAAVLYWQLSKNTKAIEFAIEGSNRNLIELLMSVMACLFIQQVVLFEPKNYILKHIDKFLGACSKFSYTLYLSHKIIFLWIQTYIIPTDSLDFTLWGIIKFITIVLFTTVTSWMLYLISERYTPKLKQVLKQKLL